MSKSLALALVLALTAGCGVTHRAYRVESLPEPEALGLLDGSPPPVERDISVCLSGGGFRATLFHAGLLDYLNSLGALPRLEGVAGVSGGSITAAWLGSVWDELEFDERGVAVNLDEKFTEPLRRFTRRTLDVSQIWSLVNPWGSNTLPKKYDRFLFEGRALADLPPFDRGPRITIVATELSSGMPWLFTRDRMGGRDIGYLSRPAVKLSQAVAASSAYPGAFRPIRLRFDEAHLRAEELSVQAATETIIEYFRGIGLEEIAHQLETEGVPEGQAERLGEMVRKYREESVRPKVGDDVFLVDGGISDNLAAVVCEQAGTPISIVSDASTVEAFAFEEDPGGLVGAVLLTVEQLHRRAENYRQQALRERAVAQLLRRPCVDVLDDCEPGTLMYVPLRPVLDEDDAYFEKVNLPTRFRKLREEQQESLLIWGRARAETAAMRLAGRR